MDINEIGKIYNLSHIDQNDPKKSAGLSQNVAEQKLAVSFLNRCSYNWNRIV